MRAARLTGQVAGGAAGALWIARRDLGLPPRHGLAAWTVVAVVATGALAAGALVALRRLLRPPGFVSIALLGWLAAVYGCVPETGQVPLVGWWLGVLGAGELVTRRALPWFVHLLMALGVLWAGVYGATYQPRAVVGACFGVWGLLVLPAVATVVPWVRRAPMLVGWVITGLGGVAALVVARTGALRPSVPGALRSAGQWGALSAAGALAVGVLSRRWPGPGRASS